ncbi:hypothetical protein [Streptomyces sp. 769]|uniref:hypothetical protein n=1 Tax=Streptomyces sp. 769 TaxID=1262452 RepID=UPI00057E5F22|nr:hypothetical protein [Streptomyces sp. 769]AJC55004.1 hypothetical protein GZL_02413 [Streptomyces sp. 769]
MPATRWSGFVPDYRPAPGGPAIGSRNTRTSIPTTAEASAWAEVLVRHRLLHEAVLAPSGQWLVQTAPQAPERVLDGPVDMVDLAAGIQHRTRTTRTRTR